MSKIIDRAEIKAKTPAQLLEFAESLGVDDASLLRRQDLVFQS